MTRRIAVVGAPSSLGIRPYEDGEQRHLDRAPNVLRGRDLVGRLGAIDFGDVAPPPYRDYLRPVEGARNEESVLGYSRALAGRVVSAICGNRFGMVIGGDCSILLGCLLAARKRLGGPIGLVYVDAHADFSTARESVTGSISGMTLALATGRGHSPLAGLAGKSPLVNGERVALVGRRSVPVASGQDALEASSILDLPFTTSSVGASGDLSAAALGRVASPGVRGFWIHLDVDVLNPSVMPAVDSPEPGGPTLDELVNLLAPLVRHPLAVGLDLSIYDPALDADRSGARQLVGLLEKLTR
ncbi:MAG TPA: arginase family protein [Vicinamibacterales bacterium]